MHLSAVCLPFTRPIIPRILGSYKYFLPLSLPIFPGGENQPSEDIAAQTAAHVIFMISRRKRRMIRFSSLEI